MMSIPDETKIEMCLRFYVNCIGKRIPSFTNNIENTALSVIQIFAMKWVGLLCNTKTRFFTFIKILDSTEVLSQLELKVRQKWLYSNI